MTMHLNRIVRAIEKKRITNLFLDDRLEASNKLLGAIRVSLEHAQKFILDADGIEQDEIDASAEAMEEMGLFNLPFGVCYMEFVARLQNVKYPNNLMTCRFCLMTTKISQEMAEWDPLAGTQLFTTIVLNFPEVDGKSRFRMLPGYMIHGAGKQFRFHNMVDDKKISESIEGFASEVGPTIADAVRTLIVLLETKGVKKEFIPTEKINLISRNEPVAGYTIVRNYAPRDSQGQRIEERKRVRLHLRRGHIRRQRWGRDRKFEKKIWIEPTLVGYEEEGRIEHLYEVDKI